ncbi:hypothetical protein TCAL_10522 [Tigriopus californicus]|uniref:DUF5641 domain-containing protein n=1 Tax=Tigriopus californicus TaxID=6832 RepID=A0A553PI36_TIGCA|nr:hypothetical protein TCAL_10522 [Tigriopus californicus]
MEYLPSLLTRNKWRIKQANIPLGCEVLIVGTPEPRSRWKFGKVVEVHPGVDDLVRAVTIQTEDGLIRRPITKICPLQKPTGGAKGIVDRIWVRWTMEYLPSLLTRNKWRIKQANIPLGCEVLIVGTPEPRSRWKFGKVVEVHPGVDDLVRAVTIQTEDGLIRRPITKICPLQKPTGGAKVTPTPPNNTGGGMDERFRAP